MSSLVFLLWFFFLWKVNGNRAYINAPNMCAAAAVILAAVYIGDITSPRKYRWAGRALLFQFIMLVGIMDGIMFGFVVWKTIVFLIAPILVLLGVLFAPSGIRVLTRAIARRRLLRERTKLMRERIVLVQNLPALESRFRYREASPDYSKLKNRLDEVNARLYELNI